MHVVLSSIAKFKENSLEFGKDGILEHSYVVFREEKHLKRVCVGGQVLDQPMPLAELVSLARVVCTDETLRIPIAICECISLLSRSLSESPPDVGRQFVLHRMFDADLFLQCLRQAHQDLFGMLEVVTLVEYLVLRLRSALYEDWTEVCVVLRRCILKGKVEFVDFCNLLGELIDLWPSIRPRVRYTGLSRT